MRFCDFCVIFIGFCDCVDSALNSTNPQNPHKNIKQMVASFGKLKLKEGRDSTFCKSKK